MTSQNTTEKKSTEGEVEEIPIIEKNTSSFREMGERERDQLERDGQQKYSIRHFSSYGALVLALIMYACGICVIFIQLKLPINAWQGWHVMLAMIIVLFTTPTVLTLAVLRSVTHHGAKDDVPTSVQEEIGKLIISLLRKFIKK